MITDKSVKQTEPCQLAIVNGDFSLEQGQEKDVGNMRILKIIIFQDVENTFVEPAKAVTLEESFAETGLTKEFTKSVEEASGETILADQNFGSLAANFSDDKTTLDVDLLRDGEKGKAGISWWKEEEKVGYLDNFSNILFRLL